MRRCPDRLVARGCVTPKSDWRRAARLQFLLFSALLRRPLEKNSLVLMQCTTTDQARRVLPDVAIASDSGESACLLSDLRTFVSSGFPIPCSPCDRRSLPIMPKFRSFLIGTTGGNQCLPPIVDWIKPVQPPVILERLGSSSLANYCGQGFQSVCSSGMVQATTCGGVLFK